MKVCRDFLRGGFADQGHDLVILIAILQSSNSSAPMVGVHGSVRK
jgi:hypothetical protein